MRMPKHEQEEIGELNIIPYLDIVTNLVMFMLLSTAGLISLGILNVGTPKLGDDASVAETTPPPKPDEKPLVLTVAIAKKGFFIMGAGGVLAGPADPTQMTAETPPTLPLVKGDYDYAGLTEKIALIKAAYPKEKRVILVAEPDIQYDIVVQTMDACREKVTTGAEGVKSSEPLFTEVWLSALR